MRPLKSPRIREPLYVSSRELELKSDYASCKVLWGHLRRDHDCHTGYSTHVMNIYPPWSSPKSYIDDEIHGGTLALLIKKSWWWCKEPSRLEE